MSGSDCIRMRCGVSGVGEVHRSGCQVADNEYSTVVAAWVTIPKPGGTGAPLSMFC